MKQNLNKTEQNLNNQNLEQPEQMEQPLPEQPEQMEQLLLEQPEQAQVEQELSLSDGQTTAIPAPEMTSRADFSQDYSPTITTNDGLYERGEFKAAFGEFLEFLHNPETPKDTIEALAAKGQGIAADKIYNLATKYKWLNWLIDRKTQVFQDTMLITIFCYNEADIIGKNWFGVSIKAKVQSWLQNQVKARIMQAIKPSGWGFLGRLGVGKRQKPAN